MTPHIESFFDSATSTVSHLVYDRAGGRAAIVDPVLDYEPAAARTSTASADRVADRAAELGLTVDWILETHVHADHLSAAHHLRERTGARIAIGARIDEVQRTFAPVFGLEPEFAVDGSQFDRLVRDGDRLTVGGLELEVIAVPGHTPADVAYRVGDAVFVGDSIFMPDVGTARCDFPGGDARALYRSLRTLLALPSDTRLMMCHDYPPAGRCPRWVSTVAEQRAANVHVHDGVDEDAFVRMRRERDATLGTPALLIPSIQVNVRAGALPPPEADGTRRLRVPLDTIGRPGANAPLPRIEPLDDHLAIAPQLQAAQMAAVARAGFRTVVDNRFDGEDGPTQPSADELRRAAERQGLRFVHLPVHPSAITRDDVAAFRAALDGGPVPALAFCRTGTRSARLYRGEHH